MKIEGKDVEKEMRTTGQSATIFINDPAGRGEEGIPKGTFHENQSTILSYSRRHVRD